MASLVFAAVTHAWLVNWEPALPAAAATAFAITFLVARVSLDAALVPVFSTIYIAPALLYKAFGVSDYHVTLVWLAALAGPVLAHADLQRWHLPARWMVPCAAWALVIAVSWPIVAGREIDFSLVAARTYDTATSMFNAPPRVAAAWIVIVALSQLLGILWIDLLFARFSGDALPRAERSIILPTFVSASAGALVGIYQATVDINWLNISIWANLQRSVGLMLDANTFGTGAAMWAPAATVLAWRRGWPLWVALMVYALLAVGMWTSDSRTALLTLLCGTAGFIVALAQRSGIWQPRMAPIVLLLGAAALVLAMSLAPRGGTSNPIERVFNRLPRLEAAEFHRVADELWTRFGYGRAAAAIFEQHPLTGVGIGAFHVVVGDYVPPFRGESLRPDNAQNWWRHQVAELGLIGALPSLWLSALILALLWKGGAYVEPFGATTILRMVLVGVGLASLVGVPTQHPASWISFVTLLFWLAALYQTAGGPQGQSQRPPSRVWWTSAFVIAGIAAAGQAVAARADLRVPVRAVRSGVHFKYGFTPSEGPSQFGDLRWAAARAVETLPVEQPWLEIALWAPEPDVQSNPVEARVSVNRRRRIAQTISSNEPVVYYLQVPTDQQQVILEVSASRALDSDHALRVAYQWMREVPRATPPERVIPY